MLTAVSLAMSTTEIAENSATPAVFTVSRDNVAGNLAVAYRVGGSAGPADLAGALSGSVLIHDGEASATISVQPVHDGLNETNETLTIQLLTPDGCGYSLGPIAQGTLRINEDGAVQGVYRTVGPGRMYATPSAAIAAAHPGDFIDIWPAASGQYLNDTASIHDNNLTIRGIGEGRIKVFSDPSTLIGNRKGIWVFEVGYDGLTVENFDFRGARVADLNGAGLRLQGDNWTVRNCLFLDNENGILASSNTGNSDVLIEYSEFSTGGVGEAGLTHNVYISTSIRSLTFQYNYSYDSGVGHLLKSRARANYILYNLLLGVGDESYEINLPEGGKSYIIGNVIRQSPGSDNTAIIDYGSEVAPLAGDFLYVVNNTIVNNRSTGTFILARRLTSGFNLTANNNIFAGSGTLISMNRGTPTTAGNLSGSIASFQFVDAAHFDYHLLADSPAIDAGVNPGSGGEQGYSLVPTSEYVKENGPRARAVDGAIDVGAYEVPRAEVVARLVFYNGSAFDGNDPGANTSDDSAVAPDKTALLPGGTATFANCTSYSRGINGIMIDIAGLANPGALSADDFEFHVSSVTAPGAWIAAPDPVSVSVREGDGVDGSDRVTVIWADHAIQNCWLNVTVKVTPNTGLAGEDVFRFANQIGDAGGDGKANIFDAFALDAAWGKGSGEAGYDINADFNRDGVVSIFDAFLLNQNWGSQLGDLPPALPPSMAAQGSEASAVEVDVVQAAAVGVADAPVTVPASASPAPVPVALASSVSRTNVDVEIVGETSPTRAAPDGVQAEVQDTTGLAEKETVSQSSTGQTVDLEAAAEGHAASAVDAEHPVPVSHREVTERSRLPAFSTTSDGHVAATPARQPAAAAAGPMLSRASPTSDEVLDLDSALADLDPLELPDLEPLHV